VLPGGFSYGDYLRAGAIARFAPAMTSVVEQAGRGLPVLGICNGFQVLCESGCCPGRSRATPTCTSSTATSGCGSRAPTRPGRAASRAGQELVVPVKNGEGNYVATTEVLNELESGGRVIARYLGSNPNGSARDIAGIRNDRGTSSGSCRTPSTQWRTSSVLRAPTAWCSSPPC
jgi:phosphoribosylformylglycinamidine synthase